MSTNPLYKNLPAEILDVPRFIVWTKEPRYPGAAATKIPYDPKTGRRASSADPATWAGFHVACNAHARFPKRYLGIGFMLGNDFWASGVDLDDCRDPSTGELHPRAKRIIDSFRTYAEVSPSGRGVKLFTRAPMPTPDGRGKNYRKNPWGSGDGGIEMYRHGRYFTLTADRLPSSPPIITDGTAALKALYDELYPPQQPAKHTTRNIADQVNASARLKRCAAYLGKLPASISGRGGHDRLFHAACVAIRFGLDDSDAVAVLNEYNKRADPPWDDRELQRKLAEAHKLAGHQFGSLLTDTNSPSKPQPQHRYRRSIVVIGGAA